MHKSFDKINVLHIFLNIQINVEKNAMIVLNMIKPPVGDGRGVRY